MSLIKLQGNASGTGALTIAAPNTNTDRTLTLPDATGTVVTADGSGNIATTSITPSAGIYLGGSGSANLLDDYEEGTWTPTVATEGGTGYTLSSSAGYYTKVGNLVCVEAAITFTAEGSGSITFISLPFTPATNTEILNGLVTQGTNNRSIQLQHYAGATVLVRFDDGTAYINYWTPTSGWAPTNTFAFSGTYRTT